VAEEWAEQNPLATIAEGFMAGYRLATQQAHAHMIAAPPVTADLGAFHPDGKVRRTIAAALELFKDQVLRDAQDEITSGEWCSIEEIDQVIRQLKDEETAHD
jgi:O-acetyl-ADP-ribose deacetylase (regulator of RNase III)